MARINSSDILDFTSRQELYQDYVEQLSQKRFTTGFELVDDAIRGVAPGEVMTIIAYSGTFKSALLQNLLMQFGKSTGLFQVMVSLEMPATKVFEREMQIGNRWTGQHVEYQVKSGNISQGIRTAGDEGAAYVLTVEKPRLSLDDLKEVLHLARRDYGHIACMGIDYLGLMKSEGNSLFERMAGLAPAVKDFAKEHNIPIIMLGQVNRGFATSKNVGIEMDAAKGGGDIEASCDFMLGLYRMTDGQIRCKILKNRNGPKDITMSVELEPHTLKFLSMSKAVECANDFNL
jgi:replicative DNA helicase